MLASPENLPVGLLRWFSGQMAEFLCTYGLLQRADLLLENWLCWVSAREKANIRDTLKKRVEIEWEALLL
jgi:hypothetical protein